MNAKRKVLDHRPIGPNRLYVPKIAASPYYLKLFPFLEELRDDMDKYDLSLVHPTDYKDWMIGLSRTKGIRVVSNDLAAEKLIIFYSE